MDLSDLLTWQGIRALASVEALNLGQQMALVEMDHRRPPIKWAHQRHWVKQARPTTPTAGTIVYARAAWRAPWRSQLVQRIQAPVVLLTTFYDPTIKECATEEMFQDGSPIRHWFGVQAATTHPMLTAMPVGVEGHIVPMIQSTEQRATRDIPLYLNFKIDHTVQHAGEPVRQTLWRQFAPQPWVTADPWVKSGEAPYLRQLGRSRFVLSPPGFGWDCYRTYEAVAMGAIPIVQRKQPMTDVCESLPCLLVDDWAEVTQERLAREWENKQPKDTRTLTLTYWRERILEAAKYLS